MRCRATLVTALQMTADLLSLLPVRRGHFLLESGYHAELWFNLDALFLSPRTSAPLVARLAERLARYNPTAVCGPLLGGAFLAQAIETELDLHFYYSRPSLSGNCNGLFTAKYELPGELPGHARGERFAIVDDVISAGSSVRATAAAITNAGGSIVSVGSLVLLGEKAQDYFSGMDILVEALEHREFQTWPPDECPLCGRGDPLEDPRCD